MIYIVIIILLLLLSFHYDINGKVKNKAFWYNVLLVIFILIAGFRWRLGVDTPNYLGNFYHEYPTLSQFSFEDYDIASSPLFVLMNSFVKSFGGRFYVVQLLQAAFVNTLVFIYIKRHSTYIFTCLFFYAIMCYTTYNMETMRASMSIVICFFANDYFLQKKWLRAYALFLIACLFHPQSIIMLLLPFLSFIRLNRVGFVFLVSSFFVGMILGNLLNDYMFIFEGADTLEDKISAYAESDKYGVGKEGNIFMIFFNYVMPIAYVIFSLLFLKKSNPESSLIKLEPFALLGLAFVLIEINFYIAYRYVDCLKFYFVLFYSELFVGFVVKVQRTKKELAFVRSIVFFIPLFYFCLFISYIKDDGKGFRYIPYDSIFERKVNRERQNRYNEVLSTKYPYPNVNEY